MTRPYCFVLMPFGQKKDAAGATTDFDAVYRDAIRPAIDAADLAPIRADEEKVGGIIQTLAAVYPRCAATAAKELLAAGRRRPLDLLEAVNFVVIGEEELDEPKAVCSLNTPEEYLAAVRASDPEATAVVEFLGRARLQTGKRELEFPVATLGELLLSLEPQLQLIAGTELVSEFRISIDGRFFSRDLSIPIGAGEHVIVLDASAGG